MYLLCLNKLFLGTPCRLCSPSYHLWKLRSYYLGWKFCRKYILRKKLLEKIQTFQFLFVSICNVVIITFPKNWIVSLKMKLPINICLCSNVGSLKVKNTSFHNFWKMAESQFCHHNNCIWSAFDFLFKFINHIFYIKCPFPINSLSNTEAPFSFKHPCSNKPFWIASCF